MEGPQQVRILVVDDHPAIRKGLVATLEPEPGFEVVATATSGHEAVAMHRVHKPDITLMDLAMEDHTSGLKAIQEIRKESVTAKIIVFSALHGDEDVYRAIHAGAITFLSKGTPDDELVSTVRKVHAGGRPISQEVAQKLADRVTGTALSGREIEVLRLIADGLRNKEIAGTLCISEDTVQSHMKNILSKLGVNDRTKAVIVAVRRGIIHLH